MFGITHPPGEIVATPMALVALGDETVERLLARHLRGDWGECGQIQDVRLTEKVYRLGHLATSDDATLNALAIAPQWFYVTRSVVSRLQQRPEQAHDWLARQRRLKSGWTLGRTLEPGQALLVLQD